MTENRSEIERTYEDMAVAKKSVQLFYDVISPFAWVAFEVSRPRPRLYVLAGGRRFVQGKITMFRTKNEKNIE